MKVLLAMDSYKGSLDAVTCCRAISRGIARVLPDAEVTSVPMSDGGEGWCDCLLSVCGGERISVAVKNAFHDPIDGYFASVQNGTCAVVETAVASGIIGIPKERLNPEVATSFGTGVLIREALDRGYRKVILGLGGSVTSDGGMGAMQALGVRFYDREGELLGLGGLQMQKVAKMDCSDLHPALKDTKVLLACDVEAVYDGELGAACVFGPQKGADPDMVKRLDSGLVCMKQAILEARGVDLSGVKGAGAAGGLCGGLLSICDAEIKSGFSLLCEIGGFEDLVEISDCVITGEGKSDAQTLMGKVAYRVGELAKKHHVPAFLLSGDVSPAAEELLNHGFYKLYRLMEDGMSADFAMAHAEELTELCAEIIAREWLKE